MTRTETYRGLCTQPIVHLPPNRTELELLRELRLRAHLEDSMDDEKVDRIYTRRETAERLRVSVRTVKENNKCPPFHLMT